MSIEAMLWAANYQDLPLDGRTKKPSPACAAVLQCLAWHASEEGTDSFPSVARIVRHTKWSEHHVQLSLQRLEEHGTIRRTPNPLRRAELIHDPRHHPASWDLVPMLRGANSDEPGHEGCKVDGLRGAKSPVGDQQDFAPERSYNLTQPKNEKPNYEKDQKLSSDADVSTASDQDQRALFGDQSPDSQARGSTPGTSAPAEGKRAGRGSRAKIPRDDLDRLFGEFWDTYAHKKAVGAARKAWPGACRKADPREIINAAARYAAGRDPRFVANGATWLNDERWLDEPEYARNGHGPGAAKPGSKEWLGSRTEADYDEDPFATYRAEQVARYGEVGTWR